MSRTTPSYFRMLLVLIALLPVAALAQASRVYKWVDEQGNVHYSDRMPAEPGAVQREVLNRDGVRIRQLDVPPLTAEAAATRQEVLKSAQRDMALAVSYDDEYQLRRAHEERLGLIRSSLAIARNNTERLRTSLADQEAHAQSLTGAGKPVPVPVQHTIDQTRQMLAEQSQETAKLEQRYNELLAQQTAEMARFQELAGNR